MSRGLRRFKLAKHCLHIGLALAKSAFARVIHLASVHSYLGGIIYFKLFDFVNLSPPF